jgi:hypothetical protein
VRRLPAIAIGIVSAAWPDVTVGPFVIVVDLFSVVYGITIFSAGPWFRAGPNGGRAMSAPSGPARLDSHHRDTLRKILQHTGGHNIEWHDVISLLQAVGSVTEHSAGKVAVTVGTQTVVLETPADKDADLPAIVELRRLLTAAGYDVEE